MKLYNIALFIFLLTGISCADKEFTNDNNPEGTVFVTAGLSSRAVIGNCNFGYYNSFWENEDSITLYTETQKNLIYKAIVLGEDNTSAEFKAKDKCLKNISGEIVYASFPASEIENNIVNLPKTSNWVETKQIPFAYAISKIEDGIVNLRFEHIFAYLEISLTNESLKEATSTDGNKTIQKVIISSPSGAIGINSGTFNYENQNISISDSTNVITVKLEKDYDPENEPERKFIIPILPLPRNAEINIYALHENNNICDTLIAYKKNIEEGIRKGRLYRKELTSEPHGFAYFKGSYYSYDNFTYDDSLRIITEVMRTYGTGNSYNSTVWEYNATKNIYNGSSDLPNSNFTTLMINETGNIYEYKTTERYTTDVYKKTFFNYDENEHLVKIKEGPTRSSLTDSTFFHWENDLLTNYYNASDTVSIKYSDVLVPNFPINLNFYLLDLGDDYNISTGSFALLNVLGKSPQYLMSSLTTSDNSKIDYIYEWNEANFLTKITINKDGNYRSHVDVIY